jgi:hypothetical protein
MVTKTTLITFSLSIFFAQSHAMQLRNGKIAKCKPNLTKEQLAAFRKELNTRTTDNPMLWLDLVKDIDNKDLPSNLRKAITKDFKVVCKDAGVPAADIAKIDQRIHQRNNE